GDGVAAGHRQHEAEHREGGGCGPGMGEQHGQVMGGLAAESGPRGDGAGQAGSERSGKEHQAGDEAKGEGGGELERAAEDSELAQLPQDTARRGGLKAVTRVGPSVILAGLAYLVLAAVLIGWGQVLAGAALIVTGAVAVTFRAAIIGPRTIAAR